MRNKTQNYKKKNRNMGQQIQRIIPYIEERKHSELWKYINRVTTTKNERTTT